MTTAVSKYHRQWVQWDNGSGTHAHLLNLVGFNKRVLEVGCSTGYLSSVMQQRGCQVTGVEIDAAAAQAARPYCREVIVGDIENLDWAAVLGGERFDVITFGDVLEHTRAPDRILKELRHYLAPGGYVVVSLPNIAHASVRLSLLLGRFEYAPLGILDETHLRFFTRETAEKLLVSSGFHVRAAWAVTEPVAPDLVRQVLDRFPRLGPEWMSALLAGEDAQAFQYVFCADTADAPAAVETIGEASAIPAWSVVITHRENDAKLSECLAALAVDPIPLRQIIVVAEFDPRPVVNQPAVVRHSRRADETDAHVLNRVLAEADGDAVLILDSGIVLQPGALNALTRRFETDPSVGVVGGVVRNADGRTNARAGAYLSPPIAVTTYRGAGSPIDDDRWTAEAEVDLVSMEMIALRRSLWQNLGGFDDQYSAGYAEADFCARVRAAGSRVIVEPDAIARLASLVEPSLTRLIAFHRDRLRFACNHYGAGMWPDGFFDAEGSFLDKAALSELERRAVRLTYLWQLAEGEDMTDDNRESFADLYHRSKAGGIRSETPRLPLHQFASFVPVVGKLIASLRTLGGSVAARWYAESIIRQQDQLNQAAAERATQLQDEISELEEIVGRLGASLRHKQDR